MRLAALVEHGMRWLDHVHHVSPCRFRCGEIEIPTA
jgi:hypothetical protein